MPGPRIDVTRLARLPAALLVLVALGGLVVSACGSEAEEPDPLLNLFGAGYPTFRDEEAGLTVILGTPDLAVGRHRLAFALFGRDDLVRVPAVDVRSAYLGDEVAADASGEPREEAVAEFFPFPFGSRGLYSTTLHLDRPGAWALEVDVPQPDGDAVTTAFRFEVAERTVAPDIGEPAPRTEHPTLADVDSLAELTTGSEPDADLYQSTIPGALDAGRPFVVVFASPAFCTNALCGPQVEVLAELEEAYGDRAEFIHIDLYENPHEIRGDLDRAVRRPLLEEWGVHTDEWTFVVDEQGRIAARFEAFVTHEELEAALLDVIGDTAAR